MNVFEILLVDINCIGRNTAQTAEMTDATNIAKVSRLRHVVPHAHSFVIVRHYSYAPIMWVSGCIVICSSPTSACLLISFVSLAQSLEGCLHDLPKRFQIISRKRIS